VTLLVSSSLVVGAQEFDYSTALEKSIYFYDANKCGPNAGENNYFDWRGACHTNDGDDVGVDLTGGFHDAGDHVKFGLPQSYSASILGWSLYENREVFDDIGMTDKLLSTLKYFTDYLLKCHPSEDVFYHQVGDGGIDHGYWGPPEEQSGSRPVQVVDPNNPGADVVGQASAALSIMYLNYKDVDQEYAERCLQAAKELYQLGKENQSSYDLQNYYQSYSFYDDLAWAATWLYIIEEDQTYLDDAEEFSVEPKLNGEDPTEHVWTMCWDDVYLPTYIKLIDITDKQKYKDAIEYSYNYWMDEVQTTPGGLKFLDNWGALRYSASQSMITMMYYHRTGKEKYKEFTQSQLNYMLGDNPQNMSYQIGFGDDFPEHPHHRAANGWTYQDSGGITQPAKHELTGALVGGPDSSDNYSDDVNAYEHTEVAIDYNAGFVGALSTLLGDGKADDDNGQTVDKGDFNEDGQIDSTDYATFRRHLLSISDLPVEDSVADLNGDGIIDSTDYVLMRRYILDIIDDFPA
jgi:hypothetical protein